MLLAVPRGLQPAERQLVVDLRARVDPRVAAVELGGGALGAVQVAASTRSTRARTASRWPARSPRPCPSRARSAAPARRPPPAPSASRGPARGRPSARGTSRRPGLRGARRRRRSRPRSRRSGAPAPRAGPRCAAGRAGCRGPPDADAQPRRLGRDGLDDLVGDGLEDVEALDRQAGLAAVVEAAHRGGAGGGLEVGVVADDHRVRAAELQRHALGADRGDRGDLLADRRRAGEGDLAHQRVAHERVAGDAARARAAR